jgi:hypothetical protein
MTVTVQIKQVYGKQAIYPVCEKAKIFAALAGTTTLTVQAIAQIKLLGYDVTVAQQTL